jgi:UDPglucose 6-dehydrogenase
VEVSLNIGIVGLGAVGSGMQKLFPDAASYDEPKGIGSREAIDACDIAFVCVPTPQKADLSCDTSIVRDVVTWIKAPLIVIRSTVAVGTTRDLASQTGKRIVFQPEYGPAETPDHPFNNLRNIRWLIFGGEPQDCRAAAQVWKRVYNSDVTIAFTTFETAELCKYMENAYLAAKVTFCNEFFGIAQALGVDYDELRELWLLDPRIGKTHTFVYPDDRGYGGRCLPKDVSSIITTASNAGYEPSLLQAVVEANSKFRLSKPINKVLADRAPSR